ncbi:MAG: M50 family metallopeptidase, partial [Coriobacteriales bacterium]|nr:M50 family metallopeptidase [Coriobacteriales bacterium]
MQILLGILSPIFWGLVMFSLIVFVHEAGHFTAARLCGMRVREFMLGLPGPNIGFRIGDTKFGVTPFLLGGYALVAGMQFEVESPTLARSLALLAEVGSMGTAAVQDSAQQTGIDVEGDLDQLADWGTIVRKRQKDGLYLYTMPASGGFSAGEARVLANPEGLISSERKLTYLGAPYHQRVLMLVNGAIFNLIFAIIVFSAAMMLIGDIQLSTVIDSVTAGSPAEAAGIQAGDELSAIDGKAVGDWNGFYEIIGSHQPGDTVTVTVFRNGVPVDFKVVLADSGERAFVGV